MIKIENVYHIITWGINYIEQNDARTSKYIWKVLMIVGQGSVQGPREKIREHMRAK